MTNESPRQKIDREYREAHALICRLYATMTPVHYIESLLRDLDIARDNERAHLAHGTISVRRCNICAVAERARYAERTR